MSEASQPPKASVEDLRQTEERFRLLVERVQDYAIFMLDTEGRIASWNIGAQRIKGYTAEEIIGRHFSIFYPSEDVASGKPANELRLAIAEGRVEDEGWRIRKDGTRFWANVVITAIFDEDGVLQGFAKVTRDLTERRRIEALQEADRQKNEFLAVLAHELRNPLAPIRNALYLIGRPGADAETIANAHAIAERQVRHMARLLDDLLDVSRVSQGRIELHRERVDLVVAMRQALDSVRGLAEDRGQHLALEAPAAPVAVDADPIRLDQMLMNLLSNAIKYTNPNGHIRLSAAREGTEAVVRVHDDGIGIAPEMLSKIFDLFVQAEPHARRGGEGVGIGLTLVRKLVELHGGTVTASSAGPGRGSEFSIRLPTAERAAAERAVAAAAAASAPPAPLRVVVVDDNADLAESLALMLRFMGNEVLPFCDGQSALDAIADFAPDLVILDIGMPGMNGYALARQLRITSAAGSPYIVALTGWGGPEDRMQSRAAGINEHLVKPVEPKALDRVLETARRRLAARKLRLN